MPADSPGKQQANTAGVEAVAILSISGISKMHIFLYFLFDSFIKTSILQLLTIYITLLIFRAQEIYTPSDLMLGYTLLYIFSILIASVISAHISIKKLRGTYNGGIKR